MAHWRTLLSMIAGLALLSAMSMGNAAQVELLLAVSINGEPTDMVCEFEERDGELYAKADELKALRVLVPETLDRAQPVRLADIPSLRYTVDQRTQSIAIEIPSSGLMVHGIGGPSSQAAPNRTSVSTGMVLNYDLLATRARGLNGLDGLIEARGFSRYGVLDSSFLGSMGEDGSFTRLDTTWTYSEPEDLRRWRLGDVISGGLTWTRPVRLGGGQVGTDFSLRPDLVTFPTPSVRGDAAVPSSVDVYVNNIRRLSEKVRPGPFEILDLPVITGSGDITVVVRDALGRETVQLLPFYAASTLLNAGLSSYSVEAGALREDFGSESNHYGEAMGSGTLRHGFSDWLTGELHGEASGRVMTGGVGAAAGIGRLGVVSAAAAVSQTNGDIGSQLAIGFEHRGADFSVGASTIMATGGYRDVAAAARSESPPSITRLNFGLPLGSAGALSLAYTMVDRDEGEDLRIGTASYSVPVYRSVVLFATGFGEIDNGDYGATIGLSFPLGGRRSGSVSGSMQGDGWRLMQQASQTAVSPGMFGWMVSNSDGGISQRRSEVTYRANAAQFLAGMADTGGDTGLRAGLRGALVGMDRSIFLSNWIDDSFAIVNTNGLADVEVSHENRPAGRTDASGKLLVTGLRSYEPNKVAIDPTGLPIDAEMASIVQDVVPEDRSGVVVDFNVRVSNSATATLIDEAGQPLAAGSKVTTEAGGVTWVGFDGVVFLTDLQASNALEVETRRGRCRVVFDFVPQPGDLPAIGPFTCTRIAQ